MTAEDAMSSGVVTALFLLEAHGRSPRTVPEVVAVAGQGLVGDLHFGGGRRQALLVDEGDLAAFGLKPGDLREQVTVRMPGLMVLPIGARIEVGEATLEVTTPCAPCTSIGRMLGVPDPEAFRQALRGRRGILAKVVAGRGQGRIAIGDRVGLLKAAPA